MKKYTYIIIGSLVLGLLTIFPSSRVEASGPPAVATISYSNVSATTATLTGWFDDDGYSTSTWFVYGTSSTNLNQSTSTVAQTLHVGNFSDTVSGLTPSTTYYFRAMAVNVYATTPASSTMSFTTSAQTSSNLTLSTLPASSVTSSGATLNGYYTASATAPFLWFQYGTSLSNLNQYTNPMSYPIGNGTYTVSISGLSASTTYYYKAYGSQNGTTFSAPTTQSFTTSGIISGLPTVSTGSATNIGQTSATLNGTVNPNGTTVNAWFEISNISGQFGNQTFSGSSTQSLSYTTSILSSNSSYQFKICAQNTSGNTQIVCGSYVPFTTLSSGGNGLPIVNTLTATNIDTDSATLRGTVNPNGNQNVSAWIEVIGYSNQYGINSYSGSSTYTLSYNFNNLNDNSTYTYHICAQNSTGNTQVVCATYQSFTTDSSNGNNGSEPDVETDSATNIGDTSAKLNGFYDSSDTPVYTWFEYGIGSSYDLSTNEVYHSSSSTSFSSTVSNLSPNTTYHVRACASNDNGSDCASSLTFTTTGTTYNPNPYYPPYTPPVPPTIIYTSSGDGSTVSPSASVTLTITPSISNVKDGDTVAYSIFCQNNSSKTLKDVTLDVMLPGGMFPMNGTTHTEIGTILPGGTCTMIVSGTVPNNVKDGNNLVSMATLNYTVSGVHESQVAYASNTVRDSSNSLAGLALFGADFTPNTLFGWLVLILIIIALIYAGRRMYYRP